MAKYYGTYAKEDAAHAEYVKRAWHWRFWDLCVAGGQDYAAPDIPIDWRVLVQDTDNSGALTENYRYTNAQLTSFLWPHGRETYDEYLQRVIKSLRVNLCGPPVQIYTRTIFSRPITREEGASASLPDVWEDVDRRGSTADEFMAEGLKGALTYGHMLAVVDVGAEAAYAKSLADERVLGVRPYVTWRTPLQLVNWSVDDFGAFVWAQFCEPYQSEAAYPGAATLTENRYRTWFADHWDLAREGGASSADGPQSVPCPWCGRAVIEYGPNTLGRVPVEVLYAERVPGCLDPIGRGLVGQIADMDRECFNLLSQKQEIIYDTGFPFIAVPDPSGTITRGDVSTKKAFPYNSTAGGGAPSYVQPSPDSVRVLQEEIAGIVLLIRGATGLTRGVSDQSIASRSGTSLLIETQDKSALISGYAGECADFEQRLWSLVAQRAGQSDEGIVVQYPERYDVRTAGDEIEDAEKLLALEPGDEVRVEVLQGLVRKMLSHLPEKRLNELVESVEAGDADMAAAPISPSMGVGIPEHADDAGHEKPAAVPGDAMPDGKRHGQPGHPGKPAEH